MEQKIKLMSVHTQCNSVCYIELHGSTSSGSKLGFKHTKEEIYMF
jgi:hypothetical protein